MEALTNDTGLLQFHQRFCLMDGRYPETRFSEIRHSIEILVEILEAHNIPLSPGILNFLVWDNFLFFIKYSTDVDVHKCARALILMYTHMLSYPYKHL